MNIETANKLLQYRKKSGFSQEELAEKVGVSRQAVSKWERAEASPDTDNLIILAGIYGVTLDELLKGDPDKIMENKKTAGQSHLTEDNEDCSADDETDGKGNFEKSGENGPDNVKDTSAETEGTENTHNTADTNADTANNNNKDTKVSFKNGIHVHDGNDHVDVSFKGVHVHSKDGTRVDVDKNGVNVIDGNGGHKVYTDENGVIHGLDKDHKKENDYTGGWNVAKKFPYPVIAVLAFFLFGSWDILGGWSTSWMWFLTIPLYYTTVDAIYKRNVSHFCYPVFVVWVFCFLGMYFGLWHPMWLLFLTIPLFYFFASFAKPKEKTSVQFKDDGIDVTVSQQENTNRENNSQYFNGQQGQYQQNSVSAYPYQKKKSPVSTIIWIIVSVIVLLAICAGIVFATTETKTYNRTYYLNEAYTDNLILDKTSGELYFHHSDKNTSYVKYSCKIRGLFTNNAKGLKITSDDDTTKISEGNFFLLFGMKDSRIDVYLTDKEYESITIDSTSGETKSNMNLRTGEFAVDNTSGEINIKNIAADKIIVDTTSGDVDIDGGYNNITVDSTSGDVVITDRILPQTMDIDITSGDTTINIPDSALGFTLEYEKSSGDIDTNFDITEDFDNNKGKAVYKGGSAKFTLDMTSGDVNINKLVQSENDKTEELTRWLFDLTRESQNP